jgi:dipeptidyl-peptidase-4
MNTLLRFSLFWLLPVPFLFSQDVRTEMKRAEKLSREAAGLVTRDRLTLFWQEDGAPLIYRLPTGKDAHRFETVDLETGKIQPAFDHAWLAGELARQTSQNVRADSLPLDSLSLSPPTDSLLFRALGTAWVYEKTNRKLTPDKQPPVPSPLLAPEALFRQTQDQGASTEITIENGTDGEIEIFWIPARGQEKSYGKIAPGKSIRQHTYAGHAWLFKDANRSPLAGARAEKFPAFFRVTGRVRTPEQPRNPISPDGNWRALILNHNLVIEPTAGGASINLSSDGSENHPYLPPLHWSPDSNKIISYRAAKVSPRQIHIVQSSPPDQLQPKLNTIEYAKPGDPIHQPKPRLFNIPERRQIALDDALYVNPWSINSAAWDRDSREYSFAYNQRGHQIMRVVAIDAGNGTTRTIVEDTSKTFIDYSQKFFLHRLADSGDWLWASERSGYNHLYRIDAASGNVRNPVTRGNWNLREVISIDESRQQIILRRVGADGQDPYHSHYAKVNFDGGGFTHLTDGDGDHRIQFSPDGRFYLDTWSRVDLPPIGELRRSSDGKSIAVLSRADDSALRKTGWSRPERFVAKGRDGQTDIHGVIIRPTRFDPTRKYPVVEDIYAGPHDHFVPKSYSPWSGLNSLAELGFIVVKIDGMGTNWRSRKFHDIAWKNLMDGGFPDRIRWIKAAAKKRPWMDLSRVGISGGSAGGQNALAGLLHHGDFYHVGVADCGCHDNRMDKIWWNEAWMGWPVDASYARNSNVTHASKLKGKLMLIVGELDTNVDPASTAQVVHALAEADKDFDFIPIMNAGHGAAETPYGSRRRADFLVRHLLRSPAARN